MRAQIDAYLCDGCGPCTEICPEVFEVSEHLARVKQDPVPPPLEEACRQAAEACPNQAIILDE